MDITEKAYLKAIEILHLCATGHGFHAAYPGYDAVWARDSMIASLGASLIDEPKFRNAFKQSLLVLGKHQSPRGQIPNAVDIFSKRRPHVDFASIDSSCWYIIGHHIYQQRYRDSSMLKRMKRHIDHAATWLSYQDAGRDHMPEQQPTTDWQDAFPHRYGHTINTMALYHKVLQLRGRKKEAGILCYSTNTSNGMKLWNGHFYIAWRWKNHVTFHERGDWFDSLGNILAILFDLADERKAKLILSYIKRNGIDRPYPVKAIYPAIRKGTKDWQPYFEDCDARIPYHYLNGGIWPYIGGFYVASLLKMKRYREARTQLLMLARAVMKKNGNFSEWLHGTNGRPSEGGNQAWNAGMYVLAYHSVKEGKSLI